MTADELLEDFALLVRNLNRFLNTQTVVVRIPPTTNPAKCSAEINNSSSPQEIEEVKD